MSTYTSRIVKCYDENEDLNWVESDDEKCPQEPMEPTDEEGGEERYLCEGCGKYTFSRYELQIATASTTKDIILQSSAFCCKQCHDNICPLCN